MTMLRRAIFGASVLALAACGDDPARVRYFAVMTGGVVQPPVTTPASGSADFSANGAKISFIVLVNNIIGVTDVSIYAGDGLTNGPVVATLFNGGPTGAIVSQTIASGTLHPAEIAGMTPESLLVLMSNGNAYLQVKTASRPDGEIRGQIHAN